MLYGKQPIVLVLGTHWEVLTEATDDEKFENFFEFVCGRLGWDVQQAEFFWIREDQPFMKIEGDKTPSNLGMKRWETAEVHAFARHFDVPNALRPRLIDFSSDDDVDSSDDDEDVY